MKHFPNAQLKQPSVPRIAFATTKKYCVDCWTCIVAQQLLHDLQKYSEIFRP
jgi:hypothetical protein